MSFLNNLNQNTGKQQTNLLGTTLNTAPNLNLNTNANPLQRNTITGSNLTFGNQSLSSSNFMGGTTQQNNLLKTGNPVGGTTNSFAGQQTTNPISGALNQTNPTNNFFQPINTGASTVNQQSTIFSSQTQSNPTLYNSNNQLAYTQTKILTLMPGNQLKYEKVNSLQSNELKELIKVVEVHFENNRLYLNNLESSFANIQENYKIIQLDAFNIAKFTKVINSKNSKLKFILQNFNNEIKNQNEVLNKNRDNCKILEHHPSMKIAVPSDYLFELLTEMEDYVKSQIKQISDLESMFNLNYQQEIGSIKLNSDIIEQIIVSMYETLMGLTNETSRICEAVERIKQIYYDFLKNNLGWKDYEIENKFRQSFNFNRLIDN